MKKQQKSWTLRGIMILLAMTILTSCDYHREEPVLDRILKQNAADSVTLTSHAYLPNRKFVSVEGLDGRDSFFVAARSSELGYKDCGSCHSVGQPVKAHERAHWEVKLVHADSSTMTCATCHSVEVGDVELRLLEGKKVSFDRADRLCAQCHFRQQKDWKGGSHGKRLGGWAPPRVSAACTECHNPHAPAFPKKFPTTNPVPVPRGE